MENKKNIVFWVLLALVTFIFLAAGITKFTGNEDQWLVFEKAGYSVTFYHFVAVLEIIGAILLWIPKCRNIGIYLLIILMIGAFVTQIINKDYLHVLNPTFWIALLLIIKNKNNKIRNYADEQ